MRKALVILLILTVVLLTAVTGGFFFLRSDTGLAFLEKKANAIGAEAGFAVSGLGGTLPNGLTVDMLALSDPEGVWLEAEQAEIRIDAAALLKKHIVIHTLETEQVRMLRKPAYPAKEQAEESGGMPEIPSFEIVNIAFPYISLPEELTGGVKTALGVKAEGQGANGVYRLKGGVYTVEGKRTELRFDADIADNVNADITFSEEPGGAVAVLAGFAPEAGLSGAIKAEGVPERFRATLSFKEGDAVLAEGEAKRDGAAFAFDGKGGWPSFLQEKLAPLGEGWRADVQAVIDGDKITFTEGQAATEAVSLTVNGAVYPQSFAAENLQVTLRVPDVAAPAAVAGVKAQGALDASLLADGEADALDLTVKASSGKITVNKSALTDIALTSDIRINAAALKNGKKLSAQTAGSAKASVEGEELALRYKGGLKDGDALTLSDLVLTTGYGKAEGTASASLSQKTFRADIRSEGLRIASFAPQSPVQATVNAHVKAEGGAESVTAYLSGDIRDIAGLPEAIKHLHGESAIFAGEVTAEPASSVSVKEFTLRSGDLSAEAKGSWPLAKNAPPSSVAATLKHKNYTPLSFKADIRPEKNALTFPAVELNAQGVTLSGSASVPAGGGAVTADMTLEAGNLAPVLAWSGGAYGYDGGSVSAKAGLKPNNGKQGIQAKATVNALSLNGGAIKINALNAALSASDIAAMQALNADITASGVQTGDTRVASLAVKARGAGEKTFTADLTVTGAQGETSFSAAAVTGIAIRGEKTVRISPQSLKGEYGIYPFMLKQPGTVTVAGGDITADNFVLKAAGADIALKGGIAAGKADIKAAISVKDIKNIPGVPKDGIPATSLKADIAVTGPVTAPIVTLRADADGAPALRGLPGTKARAEADWRGGAVKAKASLTAGDGKADADIALPASLSLQPFAFTMKQDAPLTGSVKADVPMATVAPYLRALGHEVKGLLKADAAIAGTVAKPAVTGAMRFTDGAYTHLVHGICLENADMAASFDGDTVRLTKLTAAGLDGEGTLSGTGAVSLSARTVDIAVSMERLELLCEGIAKGEIAGDIAVKGTFDDILAKGEMILGPLAVAIPGGGASGIPSIDVVKPPKEGEKAGEIEESGADIRLDIAIRAPGRIFVRGRGLDAEFKGDLSLQGNAANPVITGTLETERGSFSALGRTLRLDKGVIRFAGTRPPLPFIDIAAVTNTEGGYQISLGLEGPAVKPSLKLSSTPALPQDEALARLLFGKALSEITPLQAARLAQSAASLAGAGSGGPGIFDKVRNIIGVDTLNIGTDADGGSSLGAGKYITDKVFVGIEQGASADSRKVKTEIELTPDISAEVSTDSRGNTATGVEWRWDY